MIGRIIGFLLVRFHRYSPRASLTSVLILPQSVILFSRQESSADTRDKVGRAGVFLAGGVFKTAVYIFIIVFLIWVGKSAYQFGYDVFNQQAMILVGV